MMSKDIIATRATIEFAPNDSVFVRLGGDYTADDSNPRGGHRLIPNLCTAAACNGAFPVLANVFDSQGGINDPIQQVRSGGLSLNGEIGLNDWLKFRTITAYRKDHSKTPIDFDALPYVDLDVPAIYRNHQFSQELQLVADKGPLQGVAGLYYLNASAFDVFDVRLYTTAAGLTAATRGNVKTNTWAGFADLTYNFTDQLSLSLGGRYTWDRRSATVFRQTLLLGGSPELGGSPPFNKTGIPFPTPAASVTSNFSGRRVDKAFTPRASLTWKPNRDNTVYVSYSKGFKGGGFDPRGQSTQAPTQNPQDVFNFMTFKPEKVDSYEAGWKASVLDHRLQFAAAIFDAEYKDVQVPGSAGCTVGGIQTFCGITTNAGGARFRGVELESNLRAGENIATPGDKFIVSGSLGYLDAKYTKFVSVVTMDINGNPIPATVVDLAKYRRIQNTPKWTLSGTLDYDTPLGGGRLDINTTVSYRSASQQFELKSPMLDQPGFALWDANMVWRSRGNRWELGLHGKNLLNKKYIIGGYNFLNQNPFTGQYVGRGVLVPFGKPGLDPTLGKTGVLTAYYGNARQVFLSAAFNF
jgi:iron complex outermembrane receptor protein